jgi:ribose 5-phosphate isomerase
MEAEIDRIPGVVGNGLFCRRRADILLVGRDAGVSRLLAGGASQSP